MTAQYVTRGLLQVGDHLLSRVTVLSNKHVDVVAHDGAGAAGVFARRDGIGETRGDDLTLIRRDRKQGVFQYGWSLVVKREDFPSRGLDGLSPVVDLAQRGNDVLTYAVRCASPRIIG
jgi:hypothetical protein